MKPFGRRAHAQIPPDGACNAIAAKQHGLISRAQALQAGMSSSAIFRLTRTGRWRRVLPAIYAVSVTPLTWEARLRAALLWAGDGAVASHNSAATAWGLMDTKHAAVDISVPRKVRSPAPWLAVHYAPGLSRGDTSRIDGLPVTSPARTILDVAALLPPDELEALLDTGFRKRLLSEGRVKWELARSGGMGKSGSRALKDLLAARGSGAPHESHLEVKLSRLIRQSGLPEPVKQFEVREGDRFIARLDFAYPERRLAIEVDGFGWHSSPRQLQGDRQRQNALVIRKWKIARFASDDIKHHPYRVIEEIRALLNQ